MLATWCALAILAQTPAPWSAAVTAERTRESLRYRFENPSSFSTTELVPHFFEQTYDTANLWLGARLTHPFFGSAAEARAALTPQATRRADDFDTFFQPDGNVIVSGTTGDASIRSWRIEERILLRARRGVQIGGVITYRRDTARFHDGLGIVTMTLPPSEERRLVTTREFTTSGMFDTSVFVDVTRGAFSAGGALSPVGSAKLSIELPDKYPGRVIRFDSRYAAASVELRYARRAGPVRLRAGVRGLATWPWHDSAAVYRRSIAVFLEAGD